MKTRNAEAARLEADYLARVTAAMAGRETSEVDEVIQSVAEYIEEELSGTAEDQVSLVQMANVLEQLGPPEDYAQEERIALGVVAKTIAMTDKNPSNVRTSPNGAGLLVLGLLSFFLGRLRRSPV